MCQKFIQQENVCRQFHADCLHNHVDYFNCKIFFGIIIRTCGCFINRKVSCCYKGTGRTHLFIFRNFNRIGFRSKSNHNSIGCICYCNDDFMDKILVYKKKYKSKLVFYSKQFITIQNSIK